MSKNKPLKFELMPGTLLIAPETRAGTGEVEGIVLPSRLHHTPINVGRILGIRPRAFDERYFNFDPGALLGKRVVMKVIGGRPVPDGTTRRVYPLTLWMNPDHPEEKPEYESSILMIIDDDMIVQNLFLQNARCMFCGDARPGKRSGRAMLLQERQIYGVMRPICPRCYCDPEGTKWDPAKTYL